MKKRETRFEGINVFVSQIKKQMLARFQALKMNGDQNIELDFDEISQHEM